VSKSCDYSRSENLFGFTLSPFVFDLLHPTHNEESNKYAWKGRSHFLKNLPFNRNSERVKMHERNWRVETRSNKQTFGTPCRNLQTRKTRHVNCSSVQRIFSLKKGSLSIVGVPRSTWRKQERELWRKHRGGEERLCRLLNEMSDGSELGNRVGLRGGKRPAANPPSLYSRLLDRYFKTTWTVFPPPWIFASWGEHAQSYFWYLKVPKCEIFDINIYCLGRRLRDWTKKIRHFVLFYACWMCAKKLFIHTESPYPWI